MNCSSCGAELTLVFDIPYRRYTDRPPYKNALRITLGGGYDMLIDPPPEYEFILCKECGTKLIKDYFKDQVDL